MTESVPIVIALTLAITIGAVVFAAVMSNHPAAPGGVVEAARTVGADVANDPERPHPWIRRFLLHRRDRTQDTGLLLTLAVGGVAIAIVIVGVLLNMVNDRSGFAHWDDSAARFGARNATTASTWILEAVTHLGSWWFVTILVAVVGVIQYRVHRRRAIPVFLATAVLATGAVNSIVKLIVDRDRPDIARLVEARGSSFPSGHSATASATYAAVAFVLCRYQPRSRRIIVATLAAIITIAVAASRVLLGVHWLTDVIAGVLVGLSCCTLCVVAFGGRIMHFGVALEGARAGARSTTRELTRSST